MYVILYLLIVGDVGEEWNYTIQRKVNFPFVLLMIIYRLQH